MNSTRHLADQAAADTRKEDLADVLLNIAQVDADTTRSALKMQNAVLAELILDHQQGGSE